MVRLLPSCLEYLRSQRCLQSYTLHIALPIHRITILREDLTLRDRSNQMVCNTLTTFDQNNHARHV